MREEPTIRWRSKILTRTAIGTFFQSRWKRFEVPSPQWFIWENIDGKGGQFAERVIFDGKLGGHEAVVADVDGDGDLDICAKLWRPRPDNANGGRNHADFLENLLVRPAESKN